MPHPPLAARPNLERRHGESTTHNQYFRFQCAHRAAKRTDLALQLLILAFRGRKGRRRWHVRHAR